MYDIAIPQNNEEELAERYLKNKIKNVVFGYFVKNKKDLENFKLNKIFYSKKLKIYYLAIVENKSLRELLKMALDLFYSESLYNDLVFISGKSLEENSKLLNNYYFNGIFLESLYSKEKFYFTNLDRSCLNKINKNKQAVLISLKSSIKDPYSFKFFFKILQKKNINFLFGSFASEKSEVPDKYQVKAFYRIFGIYYDFKVLEKFLFRQIRRTRIAKNKLYFNKDFYIIRLPFEDCYEI